LQLIAFALAAFGLALVAAPAAQAFTFDNSANTNSDGSAKYVDPDENVSRFGSGGQTTLKQGSTTLQFGAPRSFNDRYDSNRMFNPVGRPGEPDGR
jgi:lipopolysaccharide export system protein LptA